MLDLTVFPLPSAVASPAQSLPQNPSQSLLESERIKLPHGSDGRCDREELRHILLGSPEAIRQAVHQLHVLNYAESLLWTPIMAVKSQVIITPEQGAAMSFLRRSA